jgi:hypothetical protein
MHVFIGLWRAKPAWSEMNTVGRTAYLSKLSADVRKAVGDTAESIAWGENEDLASRETWQFFAVWRFAQAQQSHAYARTLSEHEWHRYFEAIHVSGSPKTPFDVLTRHVTL